MPKALLFTNLWYCNGPKIAPKDKQMQVAKITPDEPRFMLLAKKTDRGMLIIIPNKL